MNRNKFYVLIIIGLLLSNLGLIFCIDFDGEKPKRRFGGPKNIIIERLKFDESQQKDFAKMVEEHRSRSREVFHEIRELKRKLYSQLSHEQDSSFNDSLLQEISKKHDQIEKLNIDHFYKIRGLCNEDQLDGFEQLTKDLDKLFHKNHRRGRRK